MSSPFSTTHGSAGQPSTRGSFFANDELLSVALAAGGQLPNMSNRLSHYDAVETEPRIPTMSTSALAVITVLVGLQVLAIGAMLAYMYSTHVWTHTLDALAVAGLGAQLAGRGDVVFPYAATAGAGAGVGVGAGCHWDEVTPPSLRPTEVDAAGREKLSHMDGLIDMTGVVTAVQCHDENQQVEMENLPPPYCAAARGASDGREGEARARAVAETETESGEVARTVSRDSAPPYLPAFSNVEQETGRTARMGHERGEKAQGF